MVVMLYKWLFISILPLITFFSNENGSSDKASNKHPFYISVTEINHNSKNKMLEISCKLFRDDLEKTLEQNYKTTLDITDAKYKPVLDKLITDYIKKHLSIAVDNKNTSMQYVGYENDKESVYCYFEVDNILAVKKLDITNSLLHDFNTGQINIMHVVVNSRRQSTKLDYPDKQASFTF